MSFYAPSVVLVEPENPRNVGFVARAMACNDISDLRIITPLSPGDILEEAYITATSGRDLLKSATFCSTLDEAVSDMNTLIGFSRRSFPDGPVKRLLPELKSYMEDAGRSAYIFGRESTGLFKEEIAICSLVCEIPIQSSMSYNLGQAVAIALYELSGRSGFGYDPSIHSSEMAPTHAERSALVDLLKSHAPSLDRGGREDQLRRCVGKMNLTQKELHFIMGLLRECSRESSND